MKRCTGVLLVFPVALCLCLGCATRRQAVYLQGEIDDLQQKVEILRGRVTSEMQHNWVNFETSLEELQQEIKVLRANIEEDRALLNKISHDVAELKRGYEARQSALTTGGGTGVAGSSTPSHPTPSSQEVPMQDMEGSYQRAYATFKQGDYPSALKQFEVFLDTYPESEYADNACYWIGECYHQLGDHERAIVEYEKVIQRYPNGDKVPSALLKQGFSFLSLGDRVDAKLLFQKVINEYPQSPQAEIAAKKLRVLD